MFLKDLNAVLVCIDQIDIFCAVTYDMIRYLC